MAYPTTEQYTDALQHPVNTVLDPLLASGKVQTSGYGIPFARSGGFALTFKITAKGNDYAFRCFQSERPGLSERYGAVSRALSKANMPELTAFNWLPAGIRVQTKTFPTVRMDWVDGETLGVYIERTRKTKTALKALRVKLKSCADGLARNGIAHGDIQTGNIIILPSADLKLVDYDAFFVPEIAKLGAMEVGHRNFQHPQRASEQPFNRDLDAFAFFALDVALGCLEEDPTLWDSTSSDPDCILFRASDYKDPHSSQAFHLASKLPINGKRVLQLASLSVGSIAVVPPTSEILLPNLATAPISLKPLARKATTIRAGVAVSTPVQSSNKYIPTALLLDPLKIEACFRSVGKYVEVVGQVQSVRDAKTKYGTRFVHLVIGPATGRAFQITIWSEGIAALQMAGKGVSTFGKGTWVSATGLVDPAYATKTWSRVGVTIMDSSQLVALTQQEAKHRLASVGSGSTIPALGSVGSTSRSAASGSASKNQQLANSLKASIPTSATPKSQTAKKNSSYKSNSYSKKRRAYSPPSSPSTNKSSRTSWSPGCGFLILAAIIIFFLLVIFL